MNKKYYTGKQKKQRPRRRVVVRNNDDYNLTLRCLIDRIEDVIDSVNEDEQRLVPVEMALHNLRVVQNDLRMAIQDNVWVRLAALKPPLV